MIQHKIDYSKTVIANIEALAKQRELQNVIPPQPTTISQPSTIPTSNTVATEVKPPESTDQTSYIINEFQVVPLDITLEDMTTPELFLTKDQLFLTYDDLIEEYNLKELEFTLIGQEPKFAVLEQLTEKKYLYTTSNIEDLKAMKEDEIIGRLTINESGQLPRSYILRKDITVAKPYQNWAMAQIIINMKNGIQNDPMLKEMVDGAFTQFNTKTLLTFLGIFLGYLALTAIMNLLSFPSVIKSIVDLIFGGVTIAMLVWTYISIDKNNKRFYSTYLRYKV